jgi:hypothetical protein
LDRFQSWGRRRWEKFWGEDQNAVEATT